MDKRDKTLYELRKAVLKWRLESNKDKAAATYYGLTRATLMFSTLPNKDMEIIKFRLVDQTESALINKEQSNIKFYDVAIPKGFIPKEMVADCLSATKQATTVLKALVPDGTFCWDEERLEWRPWYQTELLDFCL
jgi:hypothetical protein